MSKHIKLTEHTPPSGMEWAPSSYPGPGAYVTPVGIFFVTADLLYGVNPGGWEKFVTDGAPASGAAIDVHRLLDQVIVIGGKGQP